MYSKAVFFIILILKILLSEIAFSQNLIPNASFENASQILNDSEISWYNYFDHDTPDYFNLGSETPHNNIFNSYIGGIFPKDGNAFIGLFCFRTSPSKKFKNVREFIESPLITKLTKDSIYKFQISLCLDEESNIQIQNVGVLFTAKSREISNEFKILQIKPSIAFDTIWLGSSDKWITLEGFYKSNGSEEYIVLGNFYPDYKTKTKTRKPAESNGKKEKWKLMKNEFTAYYYIDDLSLEMVNANNMDTTKVDSESSPNEFEAARIKKDSAVILSNVTFVFNTSEFTEGSFPELGKLLRLLQSDNAIRIKINGYTDNIGSRAYNLRLSYQRSEAVKNFLVGEGIEENRIECEGYGFERPVKQNNSEENRQLNRRVEFIILDKPNSYE